MTNESKNGRGERVQAWRRRVRAGASRLRRTVPFVSGIVAALIAVALYGALVPGPKPPTAQDVRTAVDQALASQTPAPALPQQAYDGVRSSLVLIETHSNSSTGGPPDGLGSGVVVDAAGDILTALHVVDGATSIQLTFADGTRSD